MRRHTGACSGRRAGISVHYLKALLLTGCLAALSLVLLCSCEAAETEAVVSDSIVVSEADIVINEVLTSNSASAKAYDGRYYDWVELYNPTPYTVSLDGYYLTDNIENYQKASLRGQRIAPGGYLLIYCSGLNITDERGFLHTPFKLSAENGETLFLSNDSAISRLSVPKSKENVSYGLDSEGKYVWFKNPTPGQPNEPSGEMTASSVVINEYMISNTFTVYDCEGDYGDWIELYNAGGRKVDLAGYGLTDNDDNAFKYVFPEGVVIEPEQYLLVFCDGKNKVDAEGVPHTNFSLGAEDKVIELYSAENIPVDRADVIGTMPDNISCGLVEGESQMKLFARPTPGRKNGTVWTELNVMPSPDINDGVLISEALSSSSAKKRPVSGDAMGYFPSDYIEIYNSTSGKVNLKGYTLAEEPGKPFFRFPDTPLNAGEYALVYCDGVKKAKNPSDLHAAVKINTGGETFYLADSAGRVCDVFATGKGRFGMSSGRVGSDVSQRVFFSTPTPGRKNAGKYYRTFAPVPQFSVEGGVVKKGAKVSLSAPEGYTIVYTLDGSKPTTSSKVYKKPFTVKANTVIRAASFSKQAALSECATQTYLVKNPHTLPIVCVSGDKAALIGKKGILTDVEAGAEYEVHFEFFDEKGVKAVEFECGAKHFGAYSLPYPQKGLHLALRECYGQNSVSYDFFNENPEAATTFRSLLLRPSGQDQKLAKMRDELIPAIVRGQIDIDYQEFRACALYVDCQYWGMYYIRERLDGHYLESYYGFKEGTYDLIKTQHVVQEGTIDEYNALTNFCRYHDMRIPENYQYVCSQIDLESLMNYWIIETYFLNMDTGNIRCYKEKNGKWRWMIYDFDWALNGTNLANKANMIEKHLLDPNGHGAANIDNSIIRKLLQNKDFRDRFITLYCYHIQYTFAPERTVPILEDLAKKIDGEMKRNEKRWHEPRYSKWKSNSIPMLRRALQNRPKDAYEQLKTSFYFTDRELEKYKQKAVKLYEQKHSS